MQKTRVYDDDGVQVVPRERVEDGGRDRATPGASRLLSSPQLRVRQQGLLPFSQVSDKPPDFIFDTCVCHHFF